MTKDEKQRIDRELIELLNELRVVLPGVQVLFAFLLIMPFSKGFPKVTHAERLVYIAAVLLTTISTVLLLAPSSYHRLRFRDEDKEQLIRVSNRFAIAGTAALALAILCVVYLVATYVFDVWAGLAAVVFGFVAFALFWYALPMSKPRARRVARDEWSRRREDISSSRP